MGELRKWLVLKCAMSFIFITLWWAALRHAPVGDCIAVIYTSPILTSILSRVLLKEMLPSVFIYQALLVSIGTILVVDPPVVRAMFSTTSGEASPRGDYTLVFLALGACALVPIVTKKARDCSWIEVEHVSACLAAAVLDPSLLIGQYALYGTVPRMPSAAPSEIGLIVLAAGGSFVGIAMETKGYQLADVGKASMFRYVEVPFAYVLQCFGTREPVQTQAIVGALLIMLSCFLGLKQSSAKSQDKEESDTDKLATELLGA